MTPKSEFVVEVVTIGEVTKHPNADTLSITNASGYPVIFRTGDFQPGDQAVYVPVDAMVPVSRPEFAFLKKGDAERHRIRAIRLRGVFSMGLLVPVPPELCFQDTAAFMDITKYLSPQERRELLAPAERASPRLKDPGFMPVYGLDPLRKYGYVFQPGEPVVVTEKIHGTNFRACFRDGRLWVGTHRSMRGHTYRWWEVALDRMKLKVKALFGKAGRTNLLRDTGDVWWEAVRNYALEEKLKQIPDMVLYGEVYGEGVQDLTYDSPRGRKFVAFDLYDTKEFRYLDWEDFFVLCNRLDIPTVPVLGVVKFDASATAMAEGKSTLAGHTREGVVIKPAKERWDARVGRVAMKLVGEGYLLRKEMA